MDESCERCNQMLSICGSWSVKDGIVVQSERPTPKCYEAQLATLRGIVREMGKAGVSGEWTLWFCGFCGNSGHEMIHYDNCIMLWSEVRKIMEVK